MTRNPKPQNIPITKTDSTAADLPETFLLVRESTASKLGQRADGALTYQLLADPARQHLFIRVVANAGSGSFSDQPVLVEKLRQCVLGRDMSKALRASVLAPAIRGKSACNSGFTAAALVNLGLLGRDPDKRHDLVDLGRWDSWTAEQLTSGRDLPTVKLRPEPAERPRPLQPSIEKIEELSPNAMSDELQPEGGGTVQADFPEPGDTTQPDGTGPEGDDRTTTVAEDAQPECTSERGNRKLKFRG